MQYRRSLLHNFCDPSFNNVFLIDDNKIICIVQYKCYHTTVKAIFYSIFLSNLVYSISLYTICFRNMVGKLHHSCDNYGDASERKPAEKTVLQRNIYGISLCFQIPKCICYPGLLGYSYFVGKYKLKHICLMLLAFTIVLALSTLLDSWFYHALVFTPWNYFQVNILNGVASSFGTSPWYFYFKLILTETILPIGAAVLFLIVVAVIENPKHVVVWVAVPFLLIHMLVPHKELRFLFPLINLVPILLTLGISGISTSFLRVSSRRKMLLKAFVIGLGLINLIALTVMTFRPMRQGEKLITSIIYQEYSGQDVSVIIEKGINPFNPLGNVRENTYFQRNLNIIEQEEVIDNIRLPNTAKPIFFICRKDAYDLPYNEEIIKKYNLKLKAQSIPSWIEYILIHFPWTNQSEILLLFSQEDIVKNYE